MVARIKRGWHPSWGDRRQELVFIGSTSMDQDGMTASLNACLMPEERVGSEARPNFTDPFPPWS
jgi:hypothetical protein